MIYEFKRKQYLISTNKNKVQIDVIHNFLKTAYWCRNIPEEVIKKSIENSLCYGVYAENKQIGFARVITDYATFAYLADVFILEEYRGYGLSKWLMEVILNHPDLQKIRTFSLKTSDAHKLYEKFGFNKPEHPEKIMEKSIIREY
ncbi:MAG: GNAT family N-acetyltransferase [Melioribacteraceae bacterium]|nr:GNAT family N-acetyltransferase [Melioribacteraceae bacterium]